MRMLKWVIGVYTSLPIRPERSASSRVRRGQRSAAAISAKTNRYVRLLEPSFRMNTTLLTKEVRSHLRAHKEQETDHIYGDNLPYKQLTRDFCMGLSKSVPSAPSTQQHALQLHYMKPRLPDCVCMCTLCVALQVCYNNTQLSYTKPFKRKKSPKPICGIHLYISL